MMDTQHLHRKGYDPGARKYYHYKIAFAPADRDENDGPLTPELADQYAKEYAAGEKAQKVGRKNRQERNRYEEHSIEKT